MEDLNFQKYLEVLATCCKRVFEDMTKTTVDKITVKRDENDSDEEYCQASMVSYKHLDSKVKGNIILGFKSDDMAMAVSSAIAKSIGIELDEDADAEIEDILNEFMNTVVGHALTEWDRLGSPTEFSPPKSVAGKIPKSGPLSKSYLIILTLDMNHVVFHVSFGRSDQNILAGKSVLVVDDSLVIRKLLSKSLEELGMVVHTAENGEDAVDRYKIIWPDIVVMDIVMPKMGGLEALAEIKSNFPDAKVIMLTSTSKKEEIVQARDQGVIGYLLKPVQVPKLRDLIARALDT